MTIREKIKSLNLGPDQTRAVTELVMHSFICGSAKAMSIVAPDANLDAVSDTMSRHAVEKLLDMPYLPALPKSDISVFSQVFGYDFSNDLP
jgi:hypothetical protein